MLLLLLNFFNIRFMLILGCLYFTGLCIYLCLFIRLSVYLFVCLFVCLKIHKLD